VCLHPSTLLAASFRTRLPIQDKVVITGPEVFAFNMASVMEHKFTSLHRAFKQIPALADSPPYAQTKHPVKDSLLCLIHFFVNVHMVELPA